MRDTMHLNREPVPAARERTRAAGRFRSYGIGTRSRFVVWRIFLSANRCPPRIKSGAGFSMEYALRLVHRIVRHEFGAVDVARRVRHREDDEIGDLLKTTPARVARTLVARPLRPLAFGLLKAELALGHFALPFGEALRRMDEARDHAVDANVVRRELVGEHLGEADLGRFRRPRARGEKRRVERPDAGLAAYIDDAAAA